MMQRWEKDSQCQDHDQDHDSEPQDRDSAGQLELAWVNKWVKYLNVRRLFINITLN